MKKVLCVCVFTVMASPGLRFLLLMMSHLLVFAVHTPGTENKLQKAEEALSTTIKYLDLIGQSVDPILKILQKEIPELSGAIELIHLLVTGTPREDAVLKKVVEEFKNLNFKLDQYHVEQRWDSWASGAYFKPEMDIEVAWSNYLTLVFSLWKTADEDTKKRHIDEFMTSYQKYEPATKVLHKLLTAKDTTFINNLGLMLAEHVNCHEDDIRQYTAFIESLILKGNWLNQIYYEYKNINSQARIEESAKIQYDTATAMFQVQKYCITQITDYVEKDVEGLIDKKEDRTELAEKIRSYLEKNYENYEWMVVAFKTKNSAHNIVKIRNKHTLTGFTVVTKEGVSVAVARQTKGNHKMARKITEVIEKCFKSAIPVLCYKVEEELRKCQEKVDNIPVSQIYTAVHAFHRGAHKSRTDVSYKDTEPDTISKNEYDISIQKSEGSDTYIYKGKCLIFALLTSTPFIGQFHVMIKSDEEIKNNPCSKLNCGSVERGQCDSIGRPPVAVCVCNHPYYGKNCEKNSYDYI